MGAFDNTLKNRVLQELRSTKDAARYAADNGNASLMNSILSPLTKYKPFGGDVLAKGFNNLGYAANRLDTAIGAVLRGNAKPGSMRYGLFTDTTHSTLPQVKDKVTGNLRLPKANETPEYTKIVPRASTTASLGLPITLFTTGAAVNALTDLVDKKEQQYQAVPIDYYQAPIYPPNTTTSKEVRNDK